MNARPNDSIQQTLRRLGVGLAVVVFGLSAAVGYAQSPPPSGNEKTNKKAPGAKETPGDKTPSSKRASSPRRAPKAKEDAGDKKPSRRTKPPSDKKTSDSDEKAADGSKSAEEEDSKSSRPAQRTHRRPAGEEKEDTKESDPKEPSPTGPKKVEEKPEIDADLRRQVDALIDSPPEDAEDSEKPEPRSRGSKRVSPSEVGLVKPGMGTTTTGPRPGTEGPEPKGPTTTLDIPAREASVPAEERTYWFSIKDGSYEQLVEGIARETGLGVMGESPKDGKVTFVTEEELTFDQLIKRVQMVLFNYKPHDPYWLLREDTHLEVIRITDYYRRLPRERMYPSIEEYRAANLPKDELALVLYTPQAGSIADLTVIRDFMPDYVRVTPLEERNTVSIFALSRDIEKYMDLIPIFVGDNDDPRTLELIDVEHILASEALEKLRTLMDLEASGAARPAPRPKARGASPLTGAEAPEVSVVPDDARGVIIVRAMPDKIREIKQLLPYLDVDTTRSYDPVVIKVVHTEPTELVATIQQLLSAAEPAAQPGTPTSKTTTRRRDRKSKGSRRGSSGASSVVLDEITLMPHPSARAIIVMASQDDVVRVRHFVEMFDVEDGVHNHSIALEYIDAEEVVATITELMAAGTAGTDTFTLVPDPKGRNMWFSGSEHLLAQIEEIVAAVDTADDVVTLHIHHLVNRTPSFVVGILEQMENTGATATGGKANRPTRRRGSRKAPKATPQATPGSKFTADDEQGQLFVLCTEQEWEEYLVIIEQLESETISEVPVLITVENLTPDEAINKLGTLLSDQQLAKMRFETTEAEIIVMGASELDLASIRSLLAELDRPLDIVQRTFEILYADPAELVSALNTLVSDEAGGNSAAKPGPPRKGARATRPVASRASSSELTIVELGKFLIVRTTPEKMERVAEFITEFDIEEDKRTIRVYDDFPIGTDLEDLTDTLTSLMPGDAPETAKPKGRASRATTTGAGGLRIVPRPALGKLIVIATPEEFVEVEKLLDVLRSEDQLGPTEMDFVNVEYADPAEVVEAIEPLLDLRIEQMIRTGELSAAYGGGGEATPKISRHRGKNVPAPAAAASGGGDYHLAADERMSRIVVFGPGPIVAAVRDLVRQFDVPGDTPDAVDIAFVPVEHGDPEELVEMVEPFLSMRVDELVAAGSLSAGTVEDPSATTPKRGVKGPKRGTTPRSKSGDDKRYHLAPDERNNRIVVAAPQIVIEEATRLIGEFDRPDAETDITFVTVELQNADPDEMVKAIKEMLGSGGRAGTRRAKGAKAAATAGSTDTDKLTVAAAPGGSALILRGPTEDVETATEWIEHLDNMSASGREIKTYEIRRADLRRLVDLVMYDVDSGGSKPAGKKRAAPRGKSRGVAEAPVEDEFETTITRSGADLYIQADLIARTMVVSAPPIKLARIDEIVAQMDTEEESGITGKEVPKFFYELKHVDAIDALFDLEAVLDVMWEPSTDLPKVDYAPFGETLIIKYPDERRFPEIEALIVKYVDKVPPEDLVLDREAFTPPTGMSPRDTYLWLKMNYPDYEFELIDISTIKESDYPITEVQPATRQAQANPCVLPLAFKQMADAALAIATGQTEPDQPQDDPQEDPPSDREEAEDEPAPEDDDGGYEDSDDYEESYEEPVGGEAGAPEGARPAGMTEAEERSRIRALLDEKEKRRTAKPTGEKIKVFIDESSGGVFLEGKAGILKDADEWMDKLKKEIETLPTMPDIRVFQVKHIDVYAAQEVLNEMFNATQSQRQAVTAAQRRAQQQQQAAQRRAQQQRTAKGQEEEQDKDGRQSRRGQQTQQQQVPQLPAESVRIFPNPRDRTLIVRAESTQFAVIKKLLATIDRPQPIESIHRVFQLKKLNATEVEELLRDWLGLDEQQTSQRRTSSSSNRARNARSGAAQTRQTRSTGAAGRLPKTLMQHSPTAGELGVDPRDIKISSNPETNTVLAMAPKVAIEYIADLIEDLESQEIEERIWKTYELEYAAVDEVVEYLSSRFGDSTGSSTGKKNSKGRGSTTTATTATGGLLNTASFVAFPTLNLISAQAVEEQIAEIDELIAQLDVPNAGEVFQSVALTYADAALVADTLTAMFGSTGSAGGGRKTGGRNRSANTATAAAGPTFIGEEGTKIVFFAAPERMHERIHEVIRELEEQSKGSKTVRTIILAHAKPSVVAEAIQEAYGGTSGGRGGRGGRGHQATTTGFTVTPSDDSKRIFVMADDTTFGEIKSLAEMLDVPPEIGFDFRIYKLEYASARIVYETLNKLVTDFVRAKGREGGQIEAFAVEVDDKANALVVLGGQVVFDFVENALVNIDTPANAASPPGFLMVPLKTADATEVAQSITRLWNQKTMPPGELPPQAEANRLLNVLIVRGTQDQIDEIRRDIIDPLDSYTPPALLAETITLKYAQAEEVADAISRVFEDTREAYRTMAGGGGKQPPALEMTVAITPDAATNQVIVQASETNMGKIKARIAELDREDIASRSATSTKVYTLDTADPNAVVNMIREWTRTQQQRAGRNQTPTARDTIVAVAEPTTQSVVVTASEMNHRLIQDVIDGLDNETVAARERQRHVMPLRFAAAGEVANQLTQVFRNVTRRRGDTGPAFVADTIGNTVVVSVNAEEYAEVEQLVTALDQEPGIDTQRITKVYPLIYADPASVNTVVVNMFRSTGRAQTGPLDQVASSPETATRAVVVTASTKNQEVVAAMIEALDKESTFTKVMHTYQLQKANAEEVATALQEVYRARRSNIRGDTPVQITPEAATNSLLILANQTEMDELSGLIKSLDVEPMAERQRQVRSFPLADADPWSVQEAINKLFRGSGRNERDQVTAVAEWGSQSVIVSASPENMVRIEELVAQFDVEGAAEQAVHVIALESTDAESVSQTLNEIFVKSAPRQQGNQEVPISIAALRGSKAVVVKCKDDDFARIQAAVAELDREDAVIGEEVRVVTLLYSNAEEVKTAVQEYLRKPGGSAGRGTAELAGDVRLAVLDQTNAVVVSGDLTRVEHIEKLITEMDIAGEKGSIPQIIVLQYLNVGRVLPSLEEMFEERRGGGRSGQQPPVIVANENLNALVVRGSPTDVRAIEAIVAKLDTEEAGDKPNYRVIRVATGINVEDLAEKIETTINEGVAAQQGSSGGRSGRQMAGITVTSDRRTNSLMVAGTPTLFDEAEQLARAMEEMGPAGGSQMRIIKLRGTPSDEVIRLIEQLKGEESGSSKKSGSSRRRSSSGGSRSGGSRGR